MLHRFSPEIFMSVGVPAPNPKNTAEKPSLKSSSSDFKLPIIKLARISTPSFFKFSISKSKMFPGILKGGMPYLKTPPVLCNASKIVTFIPARANSPAQHRPAGPDPTTATEKGDSALFPFEKRALSPFLSPAKRSRKCMLIAFLDANGSPFFVITQAFLH